MVFNQSWFTFECGENENRTTITKKVYVALNHKAKLHAYFLILLIKFIIFLFHLTTFYLSACELFYKKWNDTLGHT